MLENLVIEAGFTSKILFEKSRLCLYLYAFINLVTVPTSCLKTYRVFCCLICCQQDLLSYWTATNGFDSVSDLNFQL